MMNVEDTQANSEGRVGAPPCSTPDSCALLAFEKVAFVFIFPRHMNAALATS